MLSRALSACPQIRVSSSTALQCAPTLNSILYTTGVVLMSDATVLLFIQCMRATSRAPCVIKFSS